MKFELNIQKKIRISFFHRGNLIQRYSDFHMSHFLFHWILFCLNNPKWRVLNSIWQHWLPLPMWFSCVTLSCDLPEWSGKIRICLVLPGLKLHDYKSSASASTGFVATVLHKRICQLEFKRCKHYCIFLLLLVLLLVQVHALRRRVFATLAREIAL